jgi:hypothetical protein
VGLADDAGVGAALAGGEDAGTTVCARNTSGIVMHAKKQKKTARDLFLIDETGTA